MKIPRVKDFDPNAIEPVLKSPLDNMPVIEKPKKNSTNVPSKPHQLKQKKKTNTRIVKRRCPFDIYLDQYEALKEFAYEEKNNGSLGSMSQMIRDALDKYIAAKRQK
jgi:hypothetical protein